MRRFEWCVGLLLPAVAGILGAAEPPKTRSLADAKPLAVKADDTPLRKLQIERYNAALEEIQALSRRRNADPNIGALVSQMLECQRRLAGSGLEVLNDPADRIAMLEMVVEVAKEFENVMKARRDLGVGGLTDYAQARYYRADAEITLLREKQKRPK